MSERFTYADYTKYLDTSRRRAPVAPLTGNGQQRSRRSAYKPIR